MIKSHCKLYCFCRQFEELIGVGLELGNYSLGLFKSK